MDDVVGASTGSGELRVHTAVFADGERFPMLVDAQTGIPLFDPTIWSLSSYRAKSAATMEQALRGAMLLHLFCARRAIDLDARVRDGGFFSAEELDDLARQAGLPIKELQTSAVSGPRREAPAGRRRGQVSFLRVLPTAKRTKGVEPHTKGLRLAYLREYLS